MKYTSDKYISMYILIVEKKFLFRDITTKKFDRNENIGNASFIGNISDSSIPLTHIHPAIPYFEFIKSYYLILADLISSKFCFDGILTCA